MRFINKEFYMNKRVLIIASILLLVSFGAFSATSGSLTLTGTVNGILDIQVSAAAIASNLDLTTSQNDLVVATVIEKSNKADGYTVELESANATAASSSTATLNGTGTNTDALDYSLSYDGNAVNLVNGSAVVTDSNAATGAAGVSKTLAITYAGDAGLTEGSYTDTLTLTIAAK